MPANPVNYPKKAFLIHWNNELLVGILLLDLDLVNRDPRLRIILA